VAAATLPNVCKMPGPPAPFVPTPLPNIGKSSDRLNDGTTTVKIQGSKVAIKGAYYMSAPSPDVASQGTGGGLLSSCVQGKTEFTAPGSMNVKAEGKNIQLLADAMTNNGSSKNTGATLPGNIQAAEAGIAVMTDIVCGCAQLAPKAGENCRKLGERKHKCCDDAIKTHNDQGGTPKLQGEQGYNEATGAHDPSASRQWMPGMSPGQYFSGIAGKIFPDAAILNDNGEINRFCEFKFQCPAGVPTRAGAAPSAGTAPQDWTPARGTKPDQRQRTENLGSNQDPPVTNEPLLITSEDCP
jgi:uncharacterized Zn-binding protein involved in type VI secretion